MINFIIKGHELKHEVQTSIQIFYPNEHYYPVEKPEKDGITIESVLSDSISLAILYIDGKLIDEYKFNYNQLEISLKDKKRVVKTAIYELLKKHTGYRPPWGMLTGIRPAKTVNELLDKGFLLEDAFEYLTKKYQVTKEKADLAIEVAQAERALLSKSTKKDASIYIGIPFCPTRCLYCSFTSYSLKDYAHLTDKYLDALIKELEFMKIYTEKFNIKNIYVGGGTPTSLNEIQLERLLESIKNIFDFKDVQEYTVEAGRPDTITKEKLSILKKYSVGRISINPQTMNLKTLELIGRKHTVSDVIKVFDYARDLDFENINMDLILGLPNETSADVLNTMEEIYKLSPDSITVHTLAVKRASKLKENMDSYNFSDTCEMEEMLKISYEYAVKMGMNPYYMYRQKNMLGSFENVGYSKNGKEGIYNIEIMEEKQNIFAAGAGATTKLVDYETNRIDRVFNVKNVEEYISRIDEMIQRKKEGIKI